MQDLTFQPGPEFARQLDREDELSTVRDQFVFADPDMIYMDGNSLDRLPARTAARLDTAIRREWGEDLVRGWAGGWYEAPQRIGEKIGRLLGAGPGQTIVADSTTVNLFKLALAALHARPDRTRIVTDEMNFPTDLYVLQGCRQILGGRHTLHLAPSRDGIMVDADAIMDAIDAETALVTFSHPTFKSAYLYDISGGKRLRSRTLPTHNRAGQAFRLAAQSVAKSPNSAFGAFYRRMKARPRHQEQAIVATADKIARAFYHMLKHRTPFHDMGGEEYESRARQREIKNLQKRAVKLGFSIVEAPPAGAPMGSF